MSAIFIGDSIWRHAPKMLREADAHRLARELQTELDADPELKRRVATASHADARAIRDYVEVADHGRLLFCPEVAG